MDIDIEEFLRLTGYSPEVVYKFLGKRNRSISDLYCSCGKPKRLKVSKKQNWQSFDRYCGDKQCNHMFGLKRPEHSKHMKLLASDTNSKFSKNLIKSGELRNSKVNSVSFMRTKLNNKGYATENLSDSEVIQLNSKYESLKNLSRQTLEKTIKTYISQYNWMELVEFINGRELDTISNEEFSQLVYLWRSLYHYEFCSDNCGAKFFKREMIGDFSCNLANKETVKTKSSYELNYITFFEKNGIMWDYEPITINATYLGKYRPDFIFEYFGKRYLVEVKGFLKNESKEEYLKNKVNAGYRYAKERGMEFIFTYNGNPQSVEEILTDVLLEEF